LGDRQQYQSLTSWDKVTVLIYRTGIALSTLALLFLALCALRWSHGEWLGMDVRILSNILLYLLPATVGLSVIFIHLYVSAFHRFLKMLLGVAVLGVVVLAFMGRGDLVNAMEKTRYGVLLFLPLSGCLGFVTAKEAFCFRLNEGYLLALVMPVLLVASSAGVLPPSSVPGSLVIVAALLVLFAFRKVFMPLHYDIGDKSAYQ